MGSNPTSTAILFRWCNGSTRNSKLLRLGSIPRRFAISYNPLMMYCILYLVVVIGFMLWAFIWGEDTIGSSDIENDKQKAFYTVAFIAWPFTLIVGSLAWMWEKHIRWCRTKCVKFIRKYTNNEQSVFTTKELNSYIKLLSNREIKLLRYSIQIEVWYLENDEAEQSIRKLDEEIANRMFEKHFLE